MQQIPHSSSLTETWYPLTNFSHFPVYHRPNLWQPAFHSLNVHWCFQIPHKRKISRCLSPWVWLTSLSSGFFRSNSIVTTYNIFLCSWKMCLFERQNDMERKERNRKTENIFCAQFIPPNGHNSQELTGLGKNKARSQELHLGLQMGDMNFLGAS